MWQKYTYTWCNAAEQLKRLVVLARFVLHVREEIFCDVPVEHHSLNNRPEDDTQTHDRMRVCILFSTFGHVKTIWDSCEKESFAVVAAVAARKWLGGACVSQVCMRSLC